jgi:signal transduction histidine kinase
MSSSWLGRLIHAGLSQQTVRGLGSLAELIAQAAGMSGVVLWEEAGENETPPLTVFAAWMRDGPYGHAGFIPEPDAMTLMAQRDRTLTLPSGPAVHLMTSNATRKRVAAALPVDWADRSRGVMTLLGDGQLADDAFDILTELIDVLPNLCSVVRERHALALATTCGSILHEADIASPTDPLSSERLSAFLGRICQAIADGLQLLRVSLFLRKPTDPQDAYPLFASSRAADPVSGALNRDDALMIVPLTTGKRVWGRIECAGSYGPPFHFTASDHALLLPIAAQISQYWSHWLHRCETLNENLSWWNLARGITTLNKRIHDELSQRRPVDELVYQAAFQVIREVVPGCCGADIRSVENGAAHTVISSSYDRCAALDAASLIAAAVPGADQRQQDQNAQDGPVEFLTEAGKEGWLVHQPIRVSSTVYGILGAAGERGLLPSNSGQVCEVIADQLGLYHHLHRTLKDLRKAQQKVEQTLRSQAEALEDLEHQLVSPLLGATARTERVLQRGRFDSRTEMQLRAVRGLCRRASRVALSAGVFSALSRGESPSSRPDFLGADDLLRLVILNADDAQMLINPRREIRIDVDRASLRALGRQLILADNSFLEQCIGNLFDNSAKYSYDNTTVEVRGVPASDAFILQVCNTGIPLEPGDIERCTQRNWRGKAARTATGEGSGLGLWIVDNLMRSMKGRLEITADGDATIVSLSIPYVTGSRG